MARNKRKCTLKSLSDCNEALRDLGRLDILIETTQARCDRKILDAKSLAEQTASPLVSKKRELEADLELYYSQGVDELEADGKKTVEFIVGRMGRRLSHELKPLTKMRWCNVLALLISAGQRQFVRTREDVDKEALRGAGLSKQRLFELGVRLREKQTWWYEVDRTKLEAK